MAGMQEQPKRPSRNAVCADECMSPGLQSAIRRSPAFHKCDCIDPTTGERIAIASLWHCRARLPIMILLWALACIGVSRRSRLHASATLNSCGSSNRYCESRTLQASSCCTQARILSICRVSCYETATSVQCLSYLHLTHPLNLISECLLNSDSEIVFDSRYDPGLVGTFIRKNFKALPSLQELEDEFPT